MFCAAIVKIRMPWPPLALVTLHKIVEGETELELFANSDGRLGFFQKDAEGSQFFVFQPVFFSAEGASLLMFGMAEEGAVMEIRGARLQIDKTGDAPPLFFDISSTTGSASISLVGPGSWKRRGRRVLPCHTQRPERQGDRRNEVRTPSRSGPFATTPFGWAD
jgi:hypothetical protein